MAHHATGRLALDLHPDDVYWCTADPGWVTGTSYGIVAPLIHGVTSIVDEGDFDADRWYGILQDQHVSVWYTAPTAIRMLMRLGADVAREYDLSAPPGRRQRRGTAEPGGGPLGCRRLRPAVPRQLVADGDRRDHDRQHPEPPDPAGVDGPAPAGDRGGHPASGR